MSRLLGPTLFLAAGVAAGVLVFASPSAGDWAAEDGGSEICLSYGYQYGGSADIDAGGELEFESAPNFGLSVSVARSDQPDLHGEVAYSRQRTRVNLRQSNVEAPEYLMDVDMNYFLFGAIYDFPQSRQVIPCAGLYLGAATANPVGDLYDSETFFAFSVVGGLKAYFTPILGLRAQTRLLAPISLSSGTIFCSHGDCAFSVSGVAGLWQGDVSIGALVHF